MEDDEDIAHALARGFVREGYMAVTAHNIEEARRHLGDTPIDAAIIDMMLGQEMGTDLIAEMRKEGRAFPVLVLSALSGVEDRARGLEAGADDYIVKPFAFSELLARLQVQEKRYGEQGGMARFGRLRYDPATRRVSHGSQEIQLTEKEGQLLEIFLANPGVVLGRGELFRRIWQGEGRSSENVVDVYIGYLRRKLRPIADTGARIGIVTIRGKGFMLTEKRDETP